MHCKVDRETVLAGCGYKMARQEKAWERRMIMSIWISNYRKLVFANNEEQVRLSNSDCNTLERMMKYMATFRLSRFELEVIKKDLIGMAEEAQLEKVELSDRIGMPERSSATGWWRMRRDRALWSRRSPPCAIPCFGFWGSIRWDG